MPFKFNALTGNLDLVNTDTLGGLATTKGNVAVANGSTWTVLAIGSDGQTLTADSAESSGVKWSTPAGGGDVVKVGTPVDGQIGVWTGDGTIEGDAALTFDTTTDSLVVAASGNFKFGAVTILGDAAGTTTLSNIDAIDATTETTFETAIDSLTNLTVVGTIATGTWEATDVGVAHGGTGASTAADARTNLGLAIGTDVQAYDADLAALSALASTGMLARTGAATYAERTITGTSNEITVTNGDGVAGAPTLSLPATIDLGGKTSFEIPNSAAPTISVDGQIAIDTTVTDWSHGILEYYSGEQMGVVAMPIAQFTSPTDNYVVTYNATNDEFELQPGGSASLADDNVFWEARDLDVSYTPIAPLEQNTVTNVIAKTRAFDYATIEYCNSAYYVPSDIDTSGTVTFYVYWQARTAPASDENVVWQVEHAAVADAEDIDSATFTAEVATAAATSTVQNQMNYTTWTETVTNLGWVAADTVFLKWSRKSTDANDTFDTRATTADDALAYKFGMLVPRA